MDIDSLFKVPKLPTGGNKRRMPDAPTPELLKRMRTEEPVRSEPPPTNGNGKARAVTIEDVDEDMEERQEENFAPGNDPDYYAEEDEDGRFFGGGLTDEQKKILNIFDGTTGKEDVADEDLEELTIAGVRRMLLKFERAAKKNQDQRSKFPDDPTKFIDSEADLDAAIQSLLPLAQSPALAYPELVSSGHLTQLVDLMSHENVDIVIDVVALLHELTDEDVGDEAESDDEDDEESLSKKNAALKLFVDSLMEHQTMDLLVANLSRMNEAEESDRQGVFHTLGIFENTIGFNPSLATLLVQKTALLKWLMERLQWKKYDENKGYVAELLPILLQSSQGNRLMFGREKGLDVLLRVLSQYRKRDVADADEIEFMENVFDALCAVLAEPETKAAFLEEEGVELMVLIMKEKKLAKSRSIKVLDYAMSGPDGAANCERFVEVLGLKTLFSAFMNKGGKKGKAAAQSTEDTSHILGILSSLFTSLPSDSVPRLRLLSKFVDSEYEKVERLLELRDSALARLRVTDAEIAAAKKEMEDDGEEDEGDEDRWELRRLDGGLFMLQTVDYILAWVCMEDDGARAHAQFILGRKNQSLKDLVDVLQGFRDSIGAPDSQPSGGADASTNPTEPAGNDAQTQRTILQGLIDFLSKKNKRRNVGALIRVRRDEGEEGYNSSNDGEGDGVIVIDAGKTFLQSASEWFPKYGLRKIEALVLTHGHADAMNGLDDLRGWTLNNAIQSHIDIYLHRDTFQEVKRAFPYLVSKEFATGGGDVADFRFHFFEDGVPFTLAKYVQITPVALEHGVFFTSATPVPFTQTSTPIPGGATPAAPSATPHEPINITKLTNSLSLTATPAIKKPAEVRVPYLAYGFLIDAFLPSLSPTATTTANSNPTRIVYLSDVGRIPDSAWDIIERPVSSPYADQPSANTNTKAPTPALAIIDCLRPTWYASHFGIAETYETTRRLFPSSSSSLLSPSSSASPSSNPESSTSVKAWMVGFSHIWTTAEWNAVCSVLSGSLSAGSFEDSARATSAEEELESNWMKEDGGVRPGMVAEMMRPLRKVVPSISGDGPEGVLEGEYSKNVVSEEERVELRPAWDGIRWLLKDGKIVEVS